MPSEEERNKPYAGIIEAMLDEKLYGAALSSLSEKLKQVRRELNTKLLKEFVDYLNKHYYPINDDDVMEQQIETFLDERNK
jgi:hypothetical protein